MSKKQIQWIQKMVKYVDKWVNPDEMGHVWNVKYKHIVHLLNSGFLANHMPKSGYHTSLVIAFLQDACNRGRQNRQYEEDIKCGL